MLSEKYLKKIFKKVFFIQKSITFDISKATKQSNKPYQKMENQLTNEVFNAILDVIKFRNSKGKRTVKIVLNGRTMFFSSKQFAVAWLDFYKSEFIGQSYDDFSIS